MPDINVDAGYIEVNIPVIRLSPASDQRVDEFMRVLVEKAEAFWKELATRNLTSARKIYQDNIKTEQGFNSYKVLLGEYTDKAPLALAIEDGAPGFDMKRGFLKGNKNRRLIPLWKGHPSKRTVPVWVEKDSPGWWHKGWKGLNLRDDVVRYLDKVVIPEEVDKLLNGIMDDMLEGL